MRFATVFLLSVSAFLAGCANEGVIVGKNSGPQPFYHTLGVDGSYTFMLRDSGGAVHRQLVTPEVFERYAVGDYFNDLQTAPGQTPGGESKTMQPALQSPQPVVTVAQAEKTGRAVGAQNGAEEKARHRFQTNRPADEKIHPCHPPEDGAPFSQTTACQTKRSSAPHRAGFHHRGARAAAGQPARRQCASLPVRSRGPHCRFVASRRRVSSSSEEGRCLPIAPLGQICMMRRA